MVLWFLLLFVFVGCVDKSNLGQATEKDILGEDKDKNGVRDDVDKFIEENFEGVNNQNAAKQYAKYQLKYIEFKEDKKQLELLGEKLDKSLDCYRSLNLESRTAVYDSLMKKLDPIIFDTKERTLAIAKASEVMAGSVVRVKSYGTEACEFEIKK